MKFKKLFLLASSLVLLSGCAGEFDKVKYEQDSEEPKITYVNPSETGKEFTVGDEPYVITYDIGGRNGVTNKNVKLESENVDVALITAATVENNPYAVKISPVHAGETSVYIISENNPDVKGTIKVKVNPLPADAGRISLKNPIKNEIEIGETITVEVDEANGDVVWSIQYGYDYFTLSEASNTSVKVTGVKAGTASVRATVNGAFDTKQITVKPAPVQKTIYLVDCASWSGVQLAPVGKTSIPLTSTSNDEFGHPIYEFEIDGTQYESFKISHSGGISNPLHCSDFVNKNGIKNNKDNNQVELINFTAPTPSVAFGAETFEIINGYSEVIHVSSYLGNVNYEIVKLSPGDGNFISITSFDNESVTIKALAVGTVNLKAKIAGSDPEISDTIEVSVLTRPAPTAVWPTFTTIDAEETKEFTYSVTYTHGDEEIPCPVTWTIVSGGEHASVTSTPDKVKITGISAGSATLRAEYDFDKVKNFDITINAISKKSIYFTNNNNWKEVYAFIWKEGTNVKNAEWPGLKIETEVVYNSGFEECYTYSFKEGVFDHIIFNNGAGEQTDDIPLSGFNAKNNVYIKGNEKKENGKWDFDFANFTPYTGATYNIYLNALYNWNTANAKIFVHCFKSNTESYSVLMHWLSNDIYVAKIPTTYTGIVFVRNAPTANHRVWSGDDFWGQTVDLTYSPSKPQFNLTSYENGQWVARA